MMRFSLVLISAFLLSIPSLLAQSNLEAAQSQSEQLQRDRAAQEREERLEQLRAQNRLKKTGEEAGSATRELAVANSPCFDIHKIDVTGVTKISSYKIGKIKRDFVNNCLSVQDLNLILKQITGLYIDKGYIASRAYLPEQDLKDGTLEISVVEGQMEALIWDADKTKNRTQLQTAFPNRQGKIVNLRDIEQGVDQINRLQSNNAQMQLEAGSKLGQSILAIKNQQSKPWYGSISFDNLGSESTGKYKSAITLGYDDLLDMNDSFSLSYSRSLNEFPYQYGPEKNKLSDSLNINYSVPYGYWTFSLAGSLSHYETSIQGIFSEIRTSGRSDSWSVTADRVLHRDQKSKTSLSSTFLRKSNESFLMNSLIESSSRALTTANLSLTHSRQMLGGQVLATGTYERGLKLFGAFNDKTAADDSPKGQFDKLSWSLGYTAQTQAKGWTFGFDSQFSGQWSDDLLFGSEQFSIGGISSVRGVMSSLHAGNNGFLSRNELSIALPKTGEKFMDIVFGQAEFYGAIDIGQVFEQSEFDIDGDSLVGGAVGLRTKGGKFSIDLTYSDLISGSSSIQSTLDEPGVYYAKGSFSF